jgi:hypothetical protein
MYSSLIEAPLSLLVPSVLAAILSAISVAEELALVLRER